MSETVETRLTLRIPRGSQRGLHDEARERLGRADEVERVVSFEVTGVRPGLNDLRVHADATVVSETPPDRLDAALTETVGIDQVELHSESEP